MGVKRGNFIEEYVDKVVLAVIGIVCIWLLITRVFGTGNSAEINGRTLGPGNIDKYIVNTLASELENKLDEAADESRQYKYRLDEYKSRLEMSLRYSDGNAIDVSTALVLPELSSNDGNAGNRFYQIPQIGLVNDVAVCHVRRVAEVKSEQTNTTKKRNWAVRTRLEDVDLVTVEGRFNTASLFERFRESFISKDSSANIAEQRYSKPVFAAVQLQRQRLQEDGRWGGWEIVPRVRVGESKVIPDVPETVDKLALDVEILMLRFSKIDLQEELLQPEVYDFADSQGQWLPPSCAKEREEKEAKAKKERERERKLQEKQRQSRRSRQKRERFQRPGEPSPEVREPMEEYAPGPWGPLGLGRDRPVKARPRRWKSEELKKIAITDKTDFSKLEQLVFWAHDNTVKPGGTYRYKIRIGVFNPIAGQDLFSAKDAALKNDVILWSEWSQETEAIVIPQRSYFFPVKVRDTDKSVTVQVCQYLLGKWHRKDFKVKPGEEIGKVVKSSALERKKDDTIPAEIDYSTGVVLLDVVERNDWAGSGNLYRRDYSEMLYSPDAMTVKHLAIKKSYWPDELLESYKQIDKEIKQEQEAPRKKIRRQKDLRKQREQPFGPGPGPGEFFNPFLR